MLFRSLFRVVDQGQNGAVRPPVDVVVQLILAQVIDADSLTNGDVYKRQAVETWLVRIAINVCKRQLRSPWRLLRAPQESLDSLRMEGPEPPDDTLVRAIQALPPKYREVIILYYYQEWKAWEIAQRLHVPVSTVTVRLSRARGLLKERLKGWYYEQE